MRGRIHGKTGTLSHPYGISSLAGYCRGNDGHELAFVLLNSDMSVLDAHVLQRNLCKALTNN
ncbi:MAG: D-alanyl-D-alanine carboxypeptidase, partial [Prevotellaceae bacterium]|nr:D-alanyl-D-alanine carboxypeptidase [Prevotellaceae bacterium]